MSSQTTHLYAPRVRHFKSPYRLMIIVLCLLLIFIASEVMTMAFTLKENSLIEYALAGGTVSPAEAAANDLRVMTGSWLYLASYLVLAVGFLFWVYRVADNMRNMKISTEGEPQFTPGWAVGWWFVPFANIWQPLPIMRELWYRSHPVGARASCIGALTVVWWLAWIIGNLISWYYFWGRNSTTLEAMQSDNSVVLIAGGFQLVAAMLLGLLVWQISQQQVARRSNLTDVLS